MNRADFEARLLRDPELRLQMEKVEKAAKRLREAQEELVKMGSLRDYGIVMLAMEGVPLAAIARLVDVTPQRLGVIVRETVDKIRRGEVSDEAPSMTDEQFVEELRASWTESMERLEQEASR